MESEKVKEIKKALENCQKDNCLDCPYFIDEKRCRANDLLLDTITLINELESENDTLHTNLCEWRKENQKLKDENERLKRDYVVKAYEKLSERHNKLKRNFKNIEKYFKEKLKEKVNGNNVDYFVDAIKILKNTIKEMLKENE